jgi:hypothetical protein
MIDNLMVCCTEATMRTRVESRTIFGLSIGDGLSTMSRRERRLPARRWFEHHSAAPPAEAVGRRGSASGLGLRRGGVTMEEVK